ncbi:putative aldouronate transport system permease protein [Anaerotaenia torta]|uniref:carbohydrate ABC transporter permease n=1 Tax=Anaerotaenia torta TaxID=433293 RepID=UPI003D1E7398
MIKSQSTKLGDWIVAAICVIIIIICIVPLLNVFARSLSSAEALIKNEVLLFPVGLNLDAYETVLSDVKYIWSLAWTAILTVIYTVVAMIMTVFCAYPLIYDNFKGKRFFNGLIILTMYFNAGAIPNFLLMKDLDLMNKPAVLIIPGCLSVFNMIIMKSFLFGIPESLRESAQIDGAGFVQILMKIYLPLSTPVLATLSLFYAVGRWNGFSDALMYMNNRKFYPIQLLLYNILNSMMQVEVAAQEGFTTPGLSETLKAAAVMIAIIPIIMIYPWLQRYFIAGVTLGAIKE